MGLISPVLHSVARPVTLAEFLDAIRATCQPRFSHSRSDVTRKVGLAISGGVDSMALAFLASEVQRQQLHLRISDNPISEFIAIVVNHRLRPESDDEVLRVAKVVRALGLKPVVSSINWKREALMLPPIGHPNVETLARRMRYRHIGLQSSSRGINSVLVAHHADDQYETVLMRMLGGHASRGLRGIRAACEIPECEGLYGAFRSGWRDDRIRERPFFQHHNADKERKQLRKLISSLLSEELTDSQEPEQPWKSHTIFDEIPTRDLYRENIAMNDFTSASVNTEVGGVMLYRPLLEFGKDRLVATCLENKVPWFEDASNADVTLTMRNAVRAMHRGHQLPRALSRPAIVALAKRCDKRHEALEAEAARWAQQVTVHDFNSQSGTLFVRFPQMTCRVPSWQANSEFWHKARMARSREIAGLVLRHVMANVSPEHNSPLMTSLQHPISTVFPALSPNSGKMQMPPKAFNVNGVLFRPVPDTPFDSPAKFIRATIAGQVNINHSTDGTYSWYLTREPYPSPLNKPLPMNNFRYCLPLEKPIDFEDRDRTTDWTEWMAWTLWDGRFWIRVRHRLPFQPFIAPFQEEHQKPFRDRLDKPQRERMVDLLKRHAPGKARYTLPAIYLETEVDWDNLPPVPSYPFRLPEKREGHLTSRSMLLTLPSLGINTPRLNEFIHYQIRYKRLDRPLRDGTIAFHCNSYKKPYWRPRHRTRRPSMFSRRQSRGVWPETHTPCWATSGSRIASVARSTLSRRRTRQEPASMPKKNQPVSDSDQDSQFVLDV